MEIEMKPIAHFLMPSANPEQATPHSHLPRVFRKALRVVTPKRIPAHAHTDLTEYFRTEYRRDAYHNQNLEFIDTEWGDDEFGDCDNPYDGLTIVECSGDAELFEFCTGYNII
jgi:hypothetical protein